MARNVVSTSQPLATQAGVAMLRAGGNPVDAGNTRSVETGPCDCYLQIWARSVGRWADRFERDIVDAWFRQTDNKFDCIRVLRCQSRIVNEHAMDTNCQLYRAEIQI